MPSDAEPRNAILKSSTPVSLVVVGVFVMGFAAIWTGLGMGAVVGAVLDGPQDGFGNSTLEDYDAVQQIEVENESIVVRLNADPRFSSTGDWGDSKITHLRLVSADGDISERVAVPRGQQVFRFTPAAGVDGNYTLSLIHHVREDPGLFGHSAYDEEQVIEFRVEDGEVNVTAVPVVIGDE